MSLAILFHFLCAQHVSDINISIIRSLRLFCFGAVGLEWYPCCRLQPSACNTDTTPTQPHRNSNTHRTKNNTTNVVIQQNSRKLLMMDILMSDTCWAHKKWKKNSKWHPVGLLFFKYHNDARSNKHKILFEIFERDTKYVLTLNLTFIFRWIANIFAEYNQQDATFHNLFISIRRSTCFRRSFRPSSEAQNCTYSVRYLSDQYCYQLASQASSR